MISLDPRREIYVCDDSAADRFVIGAVLESSQLANAVRMFEGGPPMLAHLATAKEAGSDAALPALVLLDLNMPAMDGFEVLRRLRADPALASVIVVSMLSSSDASRDVQRAEELGADAYMTKQAGLAAYISMIDERFCNARPDSAPEPQGS